MTSWRLAIDEGGPLRLEVRRGMAGFPVELVLDGTPLVPPFDRLRLQEGLELPLPDGRTLRVGTNRADHVLLTIDGRPLPGTTPDPRALIAAAAGQLWWIAVAHAFAGLSVLRDGRRGVIAYVIMGLALVIAALGLAIHRWRSRAALLTALAIETATVLALIAAAARSAMSALLVTILIHAYVVVVLARALAAHRAARRRDHDEAATAAFE